MCLVSIPPHCPKGDNRGLVYTTTNLRTLESWLDARAGQPLEPAALHEILTEVVEETHAACDEISIELLSVTQPTQSQSQS